MKQWLPEKELESVNAGVNTVIETVFRCPKCCNFKTVRSARTAPNCPFDDSPMVAVMVYEMFE